MGLDITAWRRLRPVAEPRAQAASPEGWEYDRYRLWRLAFEWASDGGCVEFA